MADKVSTSSTLNIVTAYKDTDTRTIKLKNPRDNISTGDITALETLIRNGSDGSESILIGDKEGSDFRRINQAIKINKTTLTLDLSGEE